MDFQSLPDVKISGKSCEPEMFSPHISSRSELGAHPEPGGMQMAFVDDLLDQADHFADMYPGSATESQR
jgi:hypothetical protein